MTHRGPVPTNTGKLKSGGVILIGLLAACSAMTDASPSQTPIPASEQAAPSSEPSAEPTQETPSDPGVPPEAVRCPSGLLCQGRIAPGEYAAVLGLAGVRFTVQSEWDADIHPEDGFVSLFHAGDVRGIVGVSVVPDEVFTDPCDDQTTQPLERTPQALIAWLAQHPSVEMGEPETVTLGEATGLRVELTTTKDEPCAASTGISPEQILLWPQGQNAVFLTVDGTTAIFYVVTLGEQLFVVTAETIFEVEPWRALVEPVLESVELLSLTQLRDETALADCVRGFPCRLASGEHHTEILGATALTVTLESGWTAFLGGSAPFLILHVERPAPALIAAFPTTGEVYTDPCSVDATTMIEATVDGVADWLVEHPHLGAGDPEPVTLGGLAGLRVALAPMRPGCSGTDVSPTEVLLFRLADDFYSAFEGQSTVVFVLQAGQDILVMTASAPQDGSGLRQIEPVFESIDFTVH